MARIEKDVIIHATTQEIDEFAINARTWPEWSTGVEAVEVDHIFPEKGGKLNLKYKSAGLTFDIQFTTREIVHGSHVIWDMEGMINGYQHWTYVPAGGGAVKVSCLFEYTVPGGGLGALADKLIVERMNTANIESTLANLKKMVEG
ncbi:MAG: SRPBCC family protein [Anaerolineae bacterium]|jgi:uncharacterized membrane protein|nr:SRPBCC family protein [Anaerolineae bacterium]